MKRAYCVRWPYEPRYIASNGQDEAKWHRAVQHVYTSPSGKESLCWAAACGTRMGSAWGHTVIDPGPHPPYRKHVSEMYRQVQRAFGGEDSNYPVCQRCLRMGQRRDP